MFHVKHLSDKFEVTNKNALFKTVYLNIILKGDRNIVMIM